MAKRPPQGRGSGGRVTPKPFAAAEGSATSSTPTSGSGSGKAKPKARIPQATEAGKAKIQRTSGKLDARKRASEAVHGAKHADKPPARGSAKTETTKPASTKPGNAKASSQKASSQKASSKATTTKPSGAKASAAKAPAKGAKATAVVEPAPAPTGLGAGLRSLLVGGNPTEYVPPKERVRPWWGMGDMVLWFMVSQLVGGIGYWLILLASGYGLVPHGLGGVVGEATGQVSAGQPIAISNTIEDLPLVFYGLIQIPFWIGLVGGPLYATWRKGTTLKQDFGVAMQWIDVPMGLAIGAFTQIVLVTVLYKILFLFIGEQDVSEQARSLTDRASSPAQVVALLLIVGIGAPIAEELFFRGLSQHAIAKRAGPIVGIIGSALFFAATHLQGLQFPALLMFGLILGYLVHRFKRIGPSIWAHIGFNLVTAVTLVWSLNVPWAGT